MSDFRKRMIERKREFLTNAKTIEEWLRELPEPHATKALLNMWWEDKNTKYLSDTKALQQAFNWSRSPEGYWYWFDVETDLISKNLDNLTAEQLEEILSTRKKRPQ